MIKFVTDYPAMFISDVKALVISDLHIGLEHELYKSGIFIHAQAEKFSKILDKLIKITKAKNLIILGDLKYEVPGISVREEFQIPRFISSLIKKVKIILVKGNHDTVLEGLLPKAVKVYGSRGFKLGKYGFFHGHAWPGKSLMNCDYLFMGHIQPAIEFQDKLGYRSIQQVWLKGQLNSELVKKKYKIRKTGKLNVVVFPSFNNFSGSLSVNKKIQKELIGPLLPNKILNLDKTAAYLLDGTLLGNIDNLKS